jgi:hypothetical protein
MLGNPQTVKDRKFYRSLAAGGVEKTRKVTFRRALECYFPEYSVSKRVQAVAGGCMQGNIG